MLHTGIPFKAVNMTLNSACGRSQIVSANNATS